MNSQPTFPIILPTDTKHPCAAGAVPGKRRPQGVRLPKISQAIANLDDNELGDNLLYYDYHVKHLLSLLKKGLGPDDDAYMSAYRSFEGEVFENYAYEMLLRYAKQNSFIRHFIVKGPHKQRTKAQPNALSVNWKGQIVYRIKRNEIGEFDAMFFTDKELYFVEMTLVGSVTNLRKRMRKKRALLQTLFPHYKIKALLILNEGVTGISTLPDYATAWVTRPYSAAKVFEWLQQEKRPRRKPFRRISGKQIVDTDSLKVHPFRYYNTLGWVLNKSRVKNGVINTQFLFSQTVQRYHDLFVKMYIGYMEPEAFHERFPGHPNPNNARTYVAIEKEHSGGYILNFFLSHGRKNLELITERDGRPHSVKKDPYGVTVTEIAYISNVVKPHHALTPSQIDTVIHKLQNHRTDD